MRVADHVVEARRERMAEYLRRHAYASLRDVCVAHRISEATARRDLIALESNDRITRTYGGAMSEYHRRFPTFRDRQQQHKSAKRLIAAAAVQRIEPGMIIYLDLGTTVYAIAEAILRKPIADVRVVTNSLPVADLLAEANGIRVFLLGGELLPRQSALLGKTCEQSVKAYDIDLAFLSAEAADAKGLWNSEQSVVALQQAVLKHSRQSVMCLHAKKVTQQAECFLAKWSAFVEVITDADDIQSLTSIRRTMV